jgi:hypothetical protein
MKSALKGLFFCDVTDIFLECGRTVEKAFTKWLPGMCPTP